MVRLLVTVGMMVWTGMAFAECPDHVSKVKGIELSRAEPFFGNVYRQTPEGLTEARRMERLGAIESVSTIYVHPLAPGQRISDKGTLDLEYAADPAALDRLDETGSWTSGVVLKVNGQVALEGKVEKRFAGREAITVADCHTEVWLVEDRLDFGHGDGSWVMLYYAPTLGLVLRSVTMSADGKPQTGVAFDSIEELVD